MNLSTAQTSKRIKEVGVKKVVGIYRKTLIFQFLSESVSISSLGGIIGVIIGVLIAYFLLQQIKLDASVSLGTVLIGYGFSAFVVVGDDLGVVGLPIVVEVVSTSCGGDADR